MPELPEVETISRDLDKKVKGLIICDFWTDLPARNIPHPPALQEFKKEIISRKILRVYRKGKNILFDLSGDKILLVHQKLTGHLLYGKWKIKKIGGKYQVSSLIAGPLQEKVNNYIHLIFYLSNGWQIALSDLRKFAKIIAGEKKEIENLPEIKNLGPNPLKVPFDEFSEILKKKKGNIKTVLMDQEIFAGIGNIYSDEILWQAKINPFKSSSKLAKSELKSLYSATSNILKKAIKLKGTSISDYRDPSGQSGGYAKVRKVYQKEDKPCQRCQTPIKRVKIGSRSAHFCPVCQRL